MRTWLMDADKTACSLVLSRTLKGFHASGAPRPAAEKGGGWAASAVEVESNALLSLSVDVLDSHERVVDRQR